MIIKLKETSRNYESYGECPYYEGDFDDMGFFRSYDIYSKDFKDDMPIFKKDEIEILDENVIYEEYRNTRESNFKNTKFVNHRLLKILHLEGEYSENYNERTQRIVERSFRKFITSGDFFMNHIINSSFALYKKGKITNFILEMKKR